MQRKEHIGRERLVLTTSISSLKFLHLTSTHLGLANSISPFPTNPQEERETATTEYQLSL